MMGEFSGSINGAVGFRVSVSARRFWLASLWLVAPGIALAATPAGTVITDIATATWQIQGVTQPPASASFSLTVAQLIQATLTWQDASQVSVPAGATGALTFRLTNTGNGTDSFSLASLLPATPAPTYTPTSCKIYLDTDNSGTLTVADTLYAPGVNDPSLAANANLDVFAVCQTPASTADGSKALLSLTAQSKTLTGVDQAKCLNAACASTPNPVIGAWAVTDASAGSAQAQGQYVAASASFNFSKTQSVQDPGGGSAVVTGSVITYTLKVTPSGSSSAYSALVTDPIPANTTYKPNSITLNGASLTDASDGDAGHFNAVTNQIEVTLGQRNPGDPAQTITFQVTVN